MGDLRLRSVERRATGGDAEAALEHLLLCVRHGRLERQRLELLAYLGHEPARSLCQEGPLDESAPWDLEAWVRGLHPWGRVVEVRAAVAVAREVLPIFEGTHRCDGRPRRAIELAAAWADAPDLAPQRDAAHRIDALEGAGAAMRAARDHTVRYAACAAYHALAAAHGHTYPSSPLFQAAQAAFDAQLALRNPARLRAAVRDALLGWALRAG
jgi:hypothetical protein